MLGELPARDRTERWIELPERIRQRDRQLEADERFMEAPLDGGAELVGCERKLRANTV
jgi:hypothetical protein